MHLQIARHRSVGLTADPGNRAPKVPSSRKNFAQGCRHHLNLWMLSHNPVDHAEEGAWVELGGRRDFRARDAESFLQVLFVSHQHVNVLDDAPDNLDGAILAT